MRFEIYRRLTVRGWKFFWRLRAANHEIVAHGSTRGYSRRIDAIDVVNLIKCPDTQRAEVDIIT